MRPIFLFLWVIYGLSLTSCDTITSYRNRAYTPAPELKPLLAYLQKQQRIREEVPPLLPVIYERPSAPDGQNFCVEFGDTLLGLHKQHINLRNPFGTVLPPLCYSVLYQDHLVTLFAPGSFACYRLGSLARNKLLEQQLNTKLFQYQWLIEGRLVGLSQGQYFVFLDKGQWAPYSKPLPFAKQPKLFEDAHYISFSTCQGEWGGEVYFYDKRTGNYYLTGATCPTSILKRRERYYILSSLGHMMGFTSLQSVVDPSQLVAWKGKTKPQDRRLEEGKRPGEVNSPHAQQVFDYTGIEIEAGFLLAGYPFYLVKWRDRSFFATVKNDHITVVDPLFNTSSSLGSPVTMNYDPERVLMTFDASVEGREAGCMVIKGKQLAWINWMAER